VLTPLECTPSTSLDALCLSILGADLCSVQGLDTGDPLSIFQGLLSQLSPLLAALSPIFTIFDVIVALVDCVKAIPDSLGPPPDPTALVFAINRLLEVLAKLLGMLPQMSVPKMAKQIITAIATALLAFQRELLALVRALEAVAFAATMAAKPGNDALNLVVACAQGRVDIRMQNLNAAAAPLSRLLGIVNLLMDLAQMPDEMRPPSFTGFGSAPSEALEPLGEFCQKLLDIAALIPG
jgi:hypothetical protein